MNRIIMFPRGKTFIAARIIKTVLEPLETGDGRQVVFFCQDKSGQIYRVPKSEVANFSNHQPKVKEKARKKHGKKAKAVVL